MTGLAKASLNVRNFMKYSLSILTVYTLSKLNNFLFSQRLSDVKPTAHNI